MAFEVNPNNVVTEICGTETFMAPEVTRGRTQTTKVDIWSLGVLTHIMLTGYAPFNGRTRDKKFESICNRSLNFEKKGVKERLAAFHNGGALVKDFLSKCMEKKPEDRPTAD